MRFLDEVQAIEAIRAGIKLSPKARLAVAFWGHGAMDALSIGERADTVEIICNLTMGGTNPKEIKKMMAAGLRVRQASDLHGKVYLFDNHAIVGSSNASSNGLSFEGSDRTSWREANLMVDDPATLTDLGKWFESLETIAILPGDLILAEEAWNLRRKTVAQRKLPSLLEAVLADPGAYYGKPFYLAVVTGGLSTAGEAEMQMAIRAHGSHIDGYEDWPALPRPAQIVEVFFDDEDTSVGLFERHADLPDWKCSNGSTLQLVTKRNDIGGRGFHHADEDQWIEIALRVRATPLWDEKLGCAYVPLSELGQLVTPVHSEPARSPADQFTRELLALCDQIVAETDYRPNDFRSMLINSRGILTAKKLLSGHPSKGFEELSLRGRPNLTVEAQVIKPEWRRLFHPEEVAIAKKRLRQVGYRWDET